MSQGISGVTDKLKGRDYLFVDELGRGSFGKCFLALHRESCIDYYYACKVFKENQNSLELNIHSQLSHDNVVKFVTSFKYEKVECLLMELCELGTVDVLLQCRKCLLDTEVRCLTRQVVNGLQYLHKHLVIHRDLKLKNLMLSSQMVVKIGDFGLSTKLENPDEKRTSKCGTSNYVAPEVLGRNGYGFEVDIWAVGCIVYTLLEGREPFAGRNNEDTLKNVSSLSYSFSSKVSQAARNFVMAIFVTKSGERPTSYTVLKHPYFTSKNTLEHLDISAFYQKPALPIKPKSCKALKDRTNVAHNFDAVKLKNNFTAHGKENMAAEIKKPARCAMALRPRAVTKNAMVPLPPLETVSTNGSSIAGPLLTDLQKAMKETKAGASMTQQTHASFVCVTRWIAGLGLFGCHISDGSLSWYLPDQVTLHRSPEGAELVFYAGEPPMHLKEYEPQDGNRETMRYVDYCLQMLDKGGPDGPSDKAVLVVARKFFPQTSSLSQGKTPTIAFLLSNGACQINFSNHEKLLVNRYENLVVSWTDKKYQMCTFRDLQQSGIPSQLQDKMPFMCYFLALVQNYQIGIPKTKKTFD